MDRPWKHLSGEDLRKKAKWADHALALQIAYLRAHNEDFKKALELTLELDDEIETRKNKPVDN